jgi:hypothetical protein
VILAEELECDLYPTNGRDLSLELDRTNMCMDRVNDECAAEAE